MEAASKWRLSDEEKEKFINSLAPTLPALRTKAEISQEEMANLLGISRQTYSAIERRIRPMSWSTYLSLVLFFDHNQKTHRMLRLLELFPTELISRFNDGEDFSSFGFSKFFGPQARELEEKLDEQAKQTIQSVVMMEYARCTKLPSETVAKTFGS